MNDYFSRQSANLDIEQPVEISLESDYENIYNYVRFLENSSRIIKMKELKFKPMKTGLSILKLKANIEVYLNL